MIKLYQSDYITFFLSHTSHFINFALKILRIYDFLKDIFKKSETLITP